jgi:condensin complex subunit 2
VNVVKPTAKLGTKSNSTRLNIESTIEKNVENINQACVEKSLGGSDPSFHKLSKAFDEGGARGMMMNNLVQHRAIE